MVMGWRGRGGKAGEWVGIERVACESGLGSALRVLVGWASERLSRFGEDVLEKDPVGIVPCTLAPPRSSPLAVMK